MSLTLAEARTRAATVSAVSYEVDLDLRGAVEGGTFGCRTTVRFSCSADETFLEVTDASGLVATLDGEPLDVGALYDGRRLRLPGLAADVEQHEVVVDARLPLVTDGDGMHVVVDPADGETYVSAYVGMDVAQKVFACFDQNDLKAPIALTVTAEPAWTVLANGRVEHGAAGGDGRWRFATTPPIPVAMVVVCAGPWASRTWEHAGLPFGWHARASLAADLDRDLDELRATTEACFDHYARIFTEPYPFDSVDQVMAPGHNWGALESPGCITYRDEYLPRGHTSAVVRADRAGTIAHELSHMWFGDLVTMTWWEDTWLQESFADYMGYRVSAEAAGYTTEPVSKEARRTVTGYDADRRRSTHPIAPEAEDVPDVDAAATNFDMISYAKGGAVLHQLTVWLGDETFLRGVNTYLTRHRWGNTTLADFVAALDEVSDRDVRGWVEAWLRRSGHDTVRVTRGDGVPVLHLEPAGGPSAGPVRPHRLGVTAFDDELRAVGHELVDLPGPDGGPVRLDAFADRVVVPNSHAETFARVVLDERSRDAVTAGLPRIDDALTRAVLWSSLSRAAHEGDLDALTWVDVVARHLPGERTTPLVSAVLGRLLARTLWLRVPADDASAAVQAIGSACATGLAHATDPDLALAFASGVAGCAREPDVLRGWLDADAVGPGLPLPPAMRWQVVHRLAALGHADAAFVEAERRRDGTTDGELGATRALAARPTPEAKEAAWATLSRPDVGNRQFEAAAEGLWNLEQAALLAPYVDRYLDEAPGWAARGQAFAQTVGRAYPAVPHTEALVDALRAVLAGDRDLHPVLRRQWDDRLDDLAG